MGDLPQQSVPVANVGVEDPAEGAGLGRFGDRAAQRGQAGDDLLHRGRGIHVVGKGEPAHSKFRCGDTGVGRELVGGEKPQQQPRSDLKEEDFVRHVQVWGPAQPLDVKRTCRIQVWRGNRDEMNVLLHRYVSCVCASSPWRHATCGVTHEVAHPVKGVASP